MKILCVCLIGMILDWIFGDPVWLYHPVRIIGKWISFLEKILRKFAGDQEGNEKKLLIAGGILWILVILASAAVPGDFISGREVQPMCGICVGVFLVLSAIGSKITRKRK